MLGQRRNWLPILMLIIAFSYAEDSNSVGITPNLEQNEGKIQEDSNFPNDAENVSSSTLKAAELATSTAAPTVLANGVSFVASNVQAEQPENADEQEQEQQQASQQITKKSQTGRFKGGGTVQLVVNTPATRYPPHYHTTPYPHTRPPHYHYPPHYPYPPYPYPPYPTQAPTTSRPSWPYWPGYGGGFPGGGYPGGVFPGYGFGYGYPGYGYPWYHHHHHHWNTTDQGRSASVDIVSAHHEHLIDADDRAIEKEPSNQDVKSVPFFSFLNFNRN